MDPAATPVKFHQLNGAVLGAVGREGVGASLLIPAVDTVTHVTIRVEDLIL